MSRCWDTSTKAQMAQIMVQYGRPSRSSWAKSVRSSFGRTIMGKAIWEYPIEAWLGENSKLGMSLCTSWKRIILICVCGWHEIGWKETKSWSDVETSDQRSRFGRTNIFPGSRILGLHSKTQIIYGQNSGNQWESTPSWRRSKSGLRKSSILKTHENCVGSISSTPRLRNSRRPSRTRVKSWKHLPNCRSCYAL